jgi:hypothetical protein
MNEPPIYAAALHRPFEPDNPLALTVVGAHSGVGEESVAPEPPLHKYAVDPDFAWTYRLDWEEEHRAQLQSEQQQPSGRTIQELCHETQCTIDRRQMLLAKHAFVEHTDGSTEALGSANGSGWHETEHQRFNCVDAMQ